MRRLALSVGLALLVQAPFALCGAPPQDPQPSAAQLELERSSARIARQLEKLRGREFVRPCAVRVASKEEFLAYALARSEEALAPGELAASELLQKMLGLLPPDLDLMAITLEVLDEQVGGFYDPGQDTFYLMEGFEGPLVESILAHELTHALDDQLFDLDAGLLNPDATLDALSAYHAISEGSGMVMMMRWMMAHPPAQSPDGAASFMPGTEALGNAPAAIWKPLMFAYLQGMAFLEQGRRILRRQDRSIDANAALDQAFLAPPRSTEQVLHPEKYWDPEQLDEPRAVRQRSEDLGEEWQELARETLGELQLALVVAEPLKIDFANPAALLGLSYTHPAAAGWDGDEALLLAREDGAKLLSWGLVLDSEEDARELFAALEMTRARIATGLGQLAGAEQPSGFEFWIDPDRADCVRLVSFTGLGHDEALTLARSLLLEVGPDPLAGPHNEPAPETGAGN